MTSFSKEKQGEKMWHVEWQSAVLRIEEKRAALTTVDGELYKENKQVSTFRSDKGDADNESGVLNLNGRVTVFSIPNRATLRCDKLHYTSKGKPLIQATGNVEVDGAFGTVRGLQEVWATPDLKTFGTPDLFQER